MTHIVPVTIPPPISMYMRSNAWNTIMQTNNLHKLLMAVTNFNKRKVCRAIKYAISDSGATGYFLVEGSPVVNKQLVTDPLKITLPNGKVIWSTHTCNLNIPWLPDQITEVCIVPGLAHASLISTQKYCDTGCNVVFDVAECRVYYKGKLVITGGRDKATALWKPPINPSGAPGQVLRTIKSLNLHLPPNQSMHHIVHNVYTLPYKQNQ